MSTASQQGEDASVELRSDVRAAAGLRAQRPPETYEPARQAHVRHGKLDTVLRQSPALGARRLTLLAWQLACELELALRAGVTPGNIQASNISVENAGTPFERARLPWSAQQQDEPNSRSALREFGLLLRDLLALAPLYLEESVWMPPRAAQRVLRRRADAEVLRAIGRGLTVIARRCIAPPRAYESPAELARDLSRLAAVVGRIVVRRRAAPPVVHVSQPRPAALPRPILPSVMLPPCRSLDTLLVSPGVLSRAGY